jgi:hypothetical protein
MLDAKELEQRFLSLNPNCSLAKIQRLKRKRNSDSKHLRRVLSGIRSRCADKRNPYYGARGIACRLTLADLRLLWQRDNASSMDRPSVDRIDNDGDYVLSNCRIIEQSLNGRLSVICRNENPLSFAAHPAMYSAQACPPLQA